jgi:hypothetical protein
MTYGLYWKHADSEYRHESLVNALAEYIDVLDNVGLEVWVEDDLPTDWVHSQVWENEAACGVMLLTADPARITEDEQRVTCPNCRWLLTD